MTTPAPNGLHPNLARIAAAYDSILEQMERQQITVPGARAKIAQLEARDDQGVIWSIDPDSGAFVRKTAFGDMEFDTPPSHVAAENTSMTRSSVSAPWSFTLTLPPSVSVADQRKYTEGRASSGPQVKRCGWPPPNQNCIVSSSTMTKGEAQEVPSPTREVQAPFWHHAVASHATSHPPQ